MSVLVGALVVLAVLAVVAWAAVLLHPARPWDCRPVAEDEPLLPPPAEWPSVAAIVPARNEAGTLPLTLPALLAQEYPGDFRVVLVDDRSSDDTSAVARRLRDDSPFGARLVVVAGEPLPHGWVGKVWAQEQGLRACRDAPDYLLLTDADILHAPRSLARLVAEARGAGLALTSRMARLACASPAEHLLVPAFVWFFGLLYPMRRVNDGDSAVAAAAGGCMLLDRRALVDCGGFQALRDRVIDDVSLARLVKRPARPIRLALSRADVASVRGYPSLGSFWRMVRRSAFTELRHSWLRLAACLAALGLVFAAPVACVAAGAALALAAALGTAATSLGAAKAVALLGLLAWSLSARLYLPAIRFFGLPPWRALTLPLAGTLFGLMTLDSALRHALGRREPWRDGADAATQATAREPA